MSACPDENTVAAFVDGELPAGARAELASHVDGCADCQSLLSELARVRAESGVRASGVVASAMGATALADASSVGAADDAPAADAATGAEERRRVGRYVLESTLGRGGMGVVHRAWDPVLARHVAVKLIRPDRLDRGGADRMLREARAMAAVSHPNVVQVHDAGEHEGDVFIAMELVDGEPLSALLAKERRDPREIVRLFREAGRGLARAHAAGILHRDFKPSNVFVASSGAVKVGDFGLSRIDRAIAAETPPNPFDSRPDERETAVGAVVGTLRFMAPEQLLGTAVDARADQFSFAVSLYHALFGDFPYRGDSVQELRTSFVHRTATAPGDLRGAPRGYLTVLARALALRPEARFATMADLLDALDQVEDEAFAGHLRVHVACLYAFGACHLIATIAFAVAMIWGVALPRPPAPPDDGGGGPPSAGGLLAAALAVLAMFLWLSFMIFGTIWAPMNAWGLSKRHPWARRSTLAYGALASLTCIGLPYGIYAAWSLTRPSIVWAFQKPRP